MIDFFLASENFPFLFAALFVIVLGAVQVCLLLLGVSFDGLDGDHDIGDVDGGDFLSWLGVGRVPLSILLAAHGTIYSVCGYLLQGSVESATGSFASWPVAAIAALFPSVPLTSYVARGLGRLIPREESYAPKREALIGQVGVIVQGTATAALAAEARVPDGYGGSLYVSVVPAEPGASIPQGARVAVVGQNGRSFTVVVAPQASSASSK